MIDSLPTASTINVSSECEMVHGKELLRYVGVMLLAMIVLFGALLGMSFIIFPDSPGRIDTGLSEDSLYQTDPKYLFFSLEELNCPGPRVIVLGSSNARSGLRPQQLEPLLGQPVFNLSISGSTIGETAQVVALAYEKIPPTSWAKQTFVYGVTYYQFAAESRYWPGGVTSIDVEAARYGRYTRDGDRWRPRFPAAWMSLFEGALRPQLMVSWAIRRAGQAAGRFVRTSTFRLIGRRTPLTDFDLAVETPQEKNTEIAFRKTIIGPVDEWDDSAFGNLLSLARTIHDHGSRLIILDLPLPRWHREAMAPYQELYRLRLNAISKALAENPGVPVRSIADGFDDDEFVDGVHPRPHATGHWAERAAVEILATQHANEPNSIGGCGKAR